MVAADADRLAAFYADAFGFVRLPGSVAEPGALLALPGATVRAIRMRLGAQQIELLTVDPPGRPYPRGVGAADTIFQHIALVVTDIGAAVARVSAVGGATPISIGGPQVLPRSSGGVAAYKFRDPEGHPLELLAFPPGAVPPAWSSVPGENGLGFDHSALVVADSAASLAFYARLGYLRSAGSLNAGPEQERLDGVPGSTVEVTALGPLDAPPHIELLGTRGATRTAAEANDVAATQIAIAVEDAALPRVVESLAAHLVSPGIVDLGSGGRAALLRDPDGHRLLMRS